MVENSEVSGLDPATYLRVMRMYIDEALAIGLPPAQAHEQAQKMLGPVVEKSPPQEIPLKKAA